MTSLCLYSCRSFVLVLVMVEEDFWHLRKMIGKRGKSQIGQIEMAKTLNCSALTPSDNFEHATEWAEHKSTSIKSQY